MFGLPGFDDEAEEGSEAVEQPADRTGERPVVDREVEFLAAVIHGD